MDDSRKFFHYHWRWTPDRKIQIYQGSGWSFNDHLFILCGTKEPKFPDHPVTKQEFYALLSDLAAQGFMDNLLDLVLRT
jgi:hypothetical protein